MNKTGIDWSDTKTNTKLEETLYFYTRNDYLIINNLLNGNMDTLWEVAKIVINDNIGVLREHYNGERPPFDDKTIAWLKNRVWEKLDDKAKTEIIDVAKNDIVNILNAMKPVKNEVTLYRIIIIDNDGSRRPYTKFLSHNIGDIVEFKHISSTCINPGYEETTGLEEKTGYEFYRYEISIPKGGLVLELDPLCQDNEVLLPPVKCRITNIRHDSGNEKCRGIVELEYLEKLPVDMMVFEKARGFVYRNARPVDFARWKFHFEGGNEKAVLDALSVYQNKDGGFGHALEPDSWNPNSAPIQTWTATEILREIGFTDAAHPIIAGILRYLESGADFNGRVWLNSVESNNGFPHAPWWQYDGGSGDSYNPTACLAGFMVRFADKNSKAYQLGRRIAREAFDAYMGQELTGDMHTALCYVRLMQYCEEAGADDIFDIDVFKDRLKEQVCSCITKDTAKWETSYICKPSQFFSGADSIFYEDNKEIANYECEHIAKTQLEDGSWEIPWGWNDYAKEWAISENWWKANGAILNMLYLKGFGKLL